MTALETAHPDPADASQLRRFEALYRGQFAFVWSVARHHGVPESALEDVVQEVFITAYRRLDHLRFEVSPRAWLFGVTRHVSARHHRGAARLARRIGAFADVVRPHADPPQHRHDDAQQLEHLLAGLTEVTRAVWQMTELLGMSAPEIASELGVPLNTVYSRLRLAREQLHARVAEPTQLDAWRDGTRRRRDPPRAAQQRCWVALAPALGETGSGAVAGLVAWIKTQTGMATTMLATGAVVLGLSFRPASPRSPAPQPATESPTPVPPAASGAASPRPPAASALAAPTVVPVAGRATIQRSSGDLAVRAGGDRSADAGPAANNLSSGTADGDAQARLAEEIASIDRARVQLAAADHEAAVATLAVHARRFPGGALADVRAATEVDALCRLGDATAARAAALRLVIEHPTSALARGFEDFRCPR